MITMMIFLSLLFFSLGFIVTEKNAKFILSGYNTLSTEEQQSFPLRDYLIEFRRFHIFLGLSLLLVGLILYYTVSFDATGIFISCYPLLAYIYLSFKLKKYTIPSQQKFRNLPIYILSVVFLGVVFLLYFGFKSDELIFYEEKLFIKGMYSETILKSDIASVQFVDTLPAIKWKVNGFALGSSSKGYFKTKQGEKVKLVLNTRDKPYLLIIKGAGQKIYFAPDKEDRKKFMADIQKSFKGEKGINLTP